MVIVYGTRFIGKVDHVPGKGYVVTKVAHFCNFPLFPMGGFVVREGSEEQTLISGLRSFDGSSIPIRWASYAWGMTRAVGWVVALLASMMLLPIWLGLHGPLAFALGPPLGIALFVAHWLTRHPRRASPERARELEAVLSRADAERLQVRDRVRT